MALSLNTGGKAEVRLGFVKHDNTLRGASAKAEQRGDLRIERSEPTNGGCLRNILLSSQIRVYIRAQVDGGLADPCAIADIGTENAVRVLTEHGVPHQSSLGDAKSLRHQSACALLDDQTLRGVPALDPTPRHEGFGGWECKWGGSPGSEGSQAPAVVLNFQWVDPLTTREGERRIRLAGRDAYIGLGGNLNNQKPCIAWIVHRDHALSTGERAQEVVQIAVYAAVPAPEQCQLAQDFATAVIPKLPPP